MTVNETSFQSLALAVLGPDASSPGALEAVTLETLLWKAGEHRRQIEAAHNKLDVLGAPRFDPRDNVSRFTVAGRIDWMENNR